MSSHRQLRALATLVLRSWYRVGPRVRGGRKAEPTRGTSAVLMRLVFAALIYNFGHTSAAAVVRSDDPARAATWAGLGAGLFVLATTFALELPSPRAPTMALKSDLLELLPLSRLSKLVLTLSQGLLMLPLLLGLAITLRVERSAPVGALSAGLLAVGLFICFALLGSTLGKLVKLVFSPYTASRLSFLSAVPMLGGLLLLQGSAARAWLPRPIFGDALGRALTGGGSGLVTLGVYGASALVGAAFYRLESRHELSEPVRPGATASGLSRGADMPRLERLLTRREPGGLLQAPILTLMSAAFIGAAAWSREPRLGHGLGVFWNMAALLTLQLVGSLGMQRATRGAVRDTLARPLLGALPITPRDTLGSKAHALRVTLLTVAAPLSLLLLVLRADPGAWRELAWRLPTAFTAVAVYASAAVYVAFLTAGLGAVRPRGGMFGSLESFLLAVPFASALFAPGPGSALLSLLTLGALTFEARRAALGTVHWLDDPEREHSTEVWKALVVFGGFQGAQLLTQQLASLLGPWLTPSLQLLASYTLSAVALWAMTRREQEANIPARGLRLAPLGVALGALSGAFAWAYVRFSQPVEAGAISVSASSNLEVGLTSLGLVVVAPLVEERFFRGWLQPALAADLGPRRGFAPVLSALAFAAAHPAYSFAPVLVLGLINGVAMQRFRSLSACVIAHAIHNGIALWLGAR